jgi:hypothetical protein
MIQQKINLRYEYQEKQKVFYEKTHILFRHICDLEIQKLNNSYQHEINISHNRESFLKQNIDHCIIENKDKIQYSIYKSCLNSKDIIAKELQLCNKEHGDSLLYSMKKRREYEKHNKLLEANSNKIQNTFINLILQSNATIDSCFKQLEENNNIRKDISNLLSNNEKYLNEINSKYNMCNNEIEILKNNIFDYTNKIETLEFNNTKINILLESCKNDNLNYSDIILKLNISNYNKEKEYQTLNNKYLTIYNISKNLTETLKNKINILNNKYNNDCIPIIQSDAFICYELFKRQLIKNNINIQTICEYQFHKINNIFHISIIDIAIPNVSQ